MAQSFKQAPTPANSDPVSRNGAVTTSSIPGPPGVNRKKAKRRAKQAARQAAEKSLKSSEHESETFEDPSGHSDTQVHPSQQGGTRPIAEYSDKGLDDGNYYEYTNGDRTYLSEEDERDQDYQSYDYSAGDTNGRYINDYTSPESNKKSKKKKKSKPNQEQHGVHGRDMRIAVNSLPPPPPLPPSNIPNSNFRSGHRNSKDQIWNTSTQEERERIKDFWLSLGEEDRKSLVKIEKEAVLRKMKEQQKHTCSCTVCGRKRTAIEEELEVLYDAYYEELEQYANHQQVLDDTTFVPQIPGRFGRRKFSPGRMPALVSPLESKAGVHDLADLEDEGDEEEGDEEYDAGYDDEDSDDGSHGPLRGPAADFFTFGNSLTVKGITFVQHNA